jgi:3-oxoacyl-[acyl-carrier-protein] synthase III
MPQKRGQEIASQNMIYAKQIESAASVGDIVVSNSYFLDKELCYRDKQGTYVRKNDLTVERMIGVHGIRERRWSAPGETAKHLAKRAVEKLSIRPEVLIAAHDEWPVPIPAIAGIAQHGLGCGNAAFCDLITNGDLPGTAIAQALIDCGKYHRVLYATSPDVSAMRTEEQFDAVKFSEATILFEEGHKPRRASFESPETVDFIIVDHGEVFESKSAFVKAELGWTDVHSLDIVDGCPGYVMAVEIADALIKTGYCRTITCVGAEALEKMSDPRHLDHTLYGSAAGATTYQASNEPGIICSYFKGFGDLWHYLRWDTGVPLADNTPTGPYIVMEGHQLYRFVRRELPIALNKLISKGAALASDLDMSSVVFLLHQMNGKLIEHALCSFLGVKTSRQDLREEEIPERVVEFIDKQVPMSVQVYGNSSTATIPVTEDHARRGLIRRRFSDKPFSDVLAFGSGTRVLKMSAGAGFSLAGYIEQL